MYHYTDSGLDYIFLKNWYEEKETPYGKGVAIHNLQGLHGAISMDIVENRPVLSADEFRFLRKELEFTQASLGQILDRDAQSVANWEKGDTEIPVMAANILRAIYRERAQGNARLEELINRVNDLDREIHERKLTLAETNNGWQTAA
jgi:DNA-binding transcriptional regulator YiaG